MTIRELVLKLTVNLKYAERNYPVRIVTAQNKSLPISDFIIIPSDDAYGPHVLLLVPSEKED